MMMLALLPGVLALYWILRRGHRQAYLDVYLASLFLLPGWCRCVLAGAPDPTFCEAAILPIMGIFLLRERKNWKFSIADVPVFLLAAQMGYSEFLNSGYSDAQNLMFDMVAAGIFPYVLAKGLIRTHGDRVAFAKRIVAMLALLTLAFLCEARMGANPYRMVFDRFFPGQGSGWVTTFRYGLARTAGPYGHAILAGIVFLIGLHLQRWLANSGAWEPKFRRFNLPGLTKSRTMSLALVAGLVLTMVRGPQIGALLATVVGAIGSGRNPMKRLWITVVLLIAIGTPIAIMGYSYAAVGREHAKTTGQESAAYRKELIDKYVDIAEQHAAFGWGRNGWPKVSGMPSIDNYYLLLSLMHGVTATCFLIALLALMFFRLLRNGLKAGPQETKGSSLSFRLAGIYAGLAFSIFTVYMGDNVIPIFFTLTGFAEGYLLSRGDLGVNAAAVPALAPAQTPTFQVVLA